MRIFVLLTSILLAFCLEAQPPATADHIKALCRTGFEQYVPEAIKNLQDHYFFQEWLKTKHSLFGADFNAEQYLMNQLHKINEMVACESIGFGIQHSVYENPEADAQTLVSRVNPVDAIIYQALRIVSSEAFADAYYGRSAADSKMLVDSYQIVIDQRLGKAKMVEKPSGCFNLDGEGLQTATSTLLSSLKNTMNHGGHVTVYFNFISPYPGQPKVFHSIFANLDPDHLYLFDMNAPNWIVTYGNGGEAKYASLETLAQNALDYIRIAYLQPNVGNMETAFQWVVYSSN